MKALNKSLIRKCVSMIMKLESMETEYIKLYKNILIDNGCENIEGHRQDFGSLGDAPFFLRRALNSLFAFEVGDEVVFVIKKGLALSRHSGVIKKITDDGPILEDGATAPWKFVRWKIEPHTIVAPKENNVKTSSSTIDGDGC